MMLGLQFRISSHDVLKLVHNSRGIFEKSDESKYSNVVVKQAHLPFHTASISNMQSKYVGQYGIDHQEWYDSTETDENGKRVTVRKSRTKTDWYNTSGLTEPKDYPFCTKESQFYADNIFPRRYVHSALRMSQIDPNRFERIDLPENGTLDEEVHSHSVSFSEAKQHIAKEITELERVRANTTIRQTNSADRSKVDDLNVLFNNAKIHPFSYHVPAYIYTATIDGKTVVKIINGVNGECDGDKVYSPWKTGTAGTLLCSLAGFIFADHKVSPRTLKNIPFRAGIPGAIGGLICALMAPVITNRQYENARNATPINVIVNENVDQFRNSNSRSDYNASHSPHYDDLNSTTTNRLNSYTNSDVDNHLSAVSIDQSTYENRKNNYTRFREEYTLLGLNADDAINEATLSSARQRELDKWNENRFWFKSAKDEAAARCIKINNAYDTMLHCTVY